LANKTKTADLTFLCAFPHLAFTAKRGVKTDPEAGGLWQKTTHPNLVSNVSCGKYFARFRNNGKRIWSGLNMGNTLRCEQLVERYLQIDSGGGGNAPADRT
jgi:hypothetical protein